MKGIRPTLIGTAAAALLALAGAAHAAGTTPQTDKPGAPGSATDIQQRNGADAARPDASLEQRRADYETAKKQCDALSGDAKERCLETAKDRFEKM